MNKEDIIENNQDFYTKNLKDIKGPTKIVAYDLFFEIKANELNPNLKKFKFGTDVKNYFKSKNGKNDILEIMHSWVKLKDNSDYKITSLGKIAKKYDGKNKDELIKQAIDSIDDKKYVNAAKHDSGEKRKSKSRRKSNKKSRKRSKSTRKRSKSRKKSNKKSRRKSKSTKKRKSRRKSKY